MHSWERLYLYSQYHPRWFESPSRYQPSSEFLAVFSALAPGSWQLKRSGIWYSAVPPHDVALPDQGWKIHVSVLTKDAVEALGRVFPLLFEQNAPFKFLLDPTLAAATNSKMWQRGSSGKLVTIYPASQSQFLAMGQALAESLEHFAGPYILSDRPWPGSSTVYYRYGGFLSRTVLQVDGTQSQVICSPTGELVPDIRFPFWSPPDWAEDPFPVPTKATTAVKAEVDLGNGRFSVTSALRFSNRGGVYLARDKVSGSMWS